jgi:RNA polymerase sigma-70 factor (ECF subfamily)
MSTFEEWYEQDMMRLFNYFSYRVRDRALAEDLTAAVCEKAVQNLHRYNPLQGDMAGWIFGIARHELQHHFRADRRRQPALSLESLPDMQSRGETVEEQVDRLALVRAAIRHLGSLSERDQDIIALRYGANLTSEETARMLGLSSENVRVMLHRALQKLRNMLISEAEVVK